jgi:type VI secretion system protein VasJ
LLRTSPLDADALRVTLVALYLPILTAPETTRDARTALPAPPKLVLETLAKQTAVPPENAVRDAIAALERSRFALDIHAHLSRALERAGTAATRAREVHRHELRGLLARLPELLAREFADGTPFATAESRALFTSWDAKPESMPVPGTTDAAVEVRALEEAGRTAEALEAGVHARRRAVSGRDRFAVTVAMALAAERARALPLAGELLAELLADVDRHGLDVWEPTRAAEVHRVAARVAAALPSAPPALQTAFARLARTDAKAAFEISSSVHATPAKPGR